jgi:hypothetical protein
VTTAALAAERHAAVVASQAFRISTAHGSASEPFEISLDWSKPRPGISRALIVFHGVGRYVEGYYRTAQDAAVEAGSAARDTILIAPQFLDEEDIREHHLPADVLRWRRVAFESGAPAVAPSPIGSYEVVDALLTRLADRSLFPNLKMWFSPGTRAAASWSSDTPSSAKRQAPLRAPASISVTSSPILRRISISPTKGPRRSVARSAGISTIGSMAP